MEHRYDTWDAIDYNMYDQILCISRTYFSLPKPSSDSLVLHYCTFVYEPIIWYDQEIY